MPCLRHEVTTAAALIVCAGFVGVCFLGAPQSSLLPDHGVMTTDLRAVIAAELLARPTGGALQGKQVEDARHEIGMPPAWYYRHPAGGVQLLTAILRHNLPPWLARLIPLLLTASGIFALFLLVRSAGPGPAAAFGAMLLLACFPPLLIIADSLQFHAQAFFAKAWAFLCIATATMSPLRLRLGPLLAAGALAFAAVTLLGLETLPAIGCFAIAAPLILPDLPRAARIRRAIACTAVVGGGMAAGIASRLADVAPTFGGSWAAVVDQVLGSLRQRANPVEIAGSALAGDLWTVATRVLAYAPVHAALVVSSVALVFRRRTGGSAGRLLAAIALSEVPYFILLRGHVTTHVHTVVHLALSIAVGAALVVDAWLRRRPGLAGMRPRLVAVGSIAALALVIGAPRPSGDLLPASSPPRLRNVDRDFADVVAAVPRRAVLALVSDGPPDWAGAAVAATRGFTFVIGAADQSSSAREIIQDLPRRTTRPVFAVTETAEDSTLFQELSTSFPFISGNARYTVFSLGPIDEACNLPRERRLSPSELGRVHLVAPAALVAADFAYPLFRRTGAEISLHAPPPRFGATVVEVPLPDGLGELTHVRAKVRYPANARLTQPALDLEIDALDAVGEPLPASGSRLRLVAGETDYELAITFTSGRAPVALSLRLATAPGSPDNHAARISCSSIVVE